MAKMTEFQSVRNSAKKTENTIPYKLIAANDCVFVGLYGNLHYDLLHSVMYGPVPLFRTYFAILDYTV